MMKITTNKIRNSLLFFSILFTTALMAQSVATYSITFQGTWNETDHGPLPTNDHWSDLVGTNHNSNVVFWELGSLASAGIEDVAEVGVNTDFNNEVNSAITAGNAEQWMQQAFNPNIAMGTSMIMSVDISEDFPLLTLVTMIAPSPDWFAGVNSFSLLDGTNNWKDNITIDLFPYDAGTEDGNGYSTSNAATNPHQPISSRINITPFNDQKVGTLSLSLENVLNTNSVNFETGISIFPNPIIDSVTIKNFSSQPVTQIELFNVLGKRVYQLAHPTAQQLTNVDISTLNSGLYILKLTGIQGQSLTKKVVKQ